MFPVVFRLGVSNCRNEIVVGLASFIAAKSFVWAGVNRYREVEEAGLKLDTSLGFTEQWGFRNSYGLPFMPYDQERERVLKIVEAPLHVMDRTFYRDQVHASQASPMVIDWMEQNNKLYLPDT